MEILALILTVILAGVFLIAGIGKLLDREGSEKALASFDVPERLVKPFAAALPWIEIAVAAALLFAVTSWYASVAATLLLAAFTAGMLVQLAKGNAPDCHCFGQIHSEPVSGRSVARNVILTLSALALAAIGYFAPGRSFGRGEAAVTNEGIMQLTIGLAAVALLIAIFVVLRKISDQQGQIIRRIEILEVISAEGREHERDGVGDPQSSLPIGSPLPPFSVVGAEGISIPSVDLVAPGKPALLIFVSATCHPCEALIPEINSWIEEFGASLEVLLISSGEFANNVKKFGEANSDRIFIREGDSALEALGPLWTPTAVLIDPNGRIASRNAAGDSAIQKLVEGIREKGVDEKYLFVADVDSEAILIGEQVPQFSLRDLDGNEFTSEDLKGRNTVAAFWSTSCPFCTKMLGDLKDWNGGRNASGPELVLFSAGNPDEHRSLELGSPILLEDDYGTAMKIGMNGTPSAVLIDEDGRIASETGVGADMIWALLGETERLSKPEED
ncbi:MAG: redoxin domain-containing protein [Acidobacteriota bacterium]|nr:MAG: redoxin domain-containing protein [Acidobacteriota bacterium]